MIRRALLCVAAVGLGACKDRQAEQQLENVQIPGAAAAESPCETVMFEGSEFTVCAFDGRRSRLELRWKGEDGEALRSFERLEAELGAEAGQVAFAMNAGMYDEEGAPIGLYVAEGERLKRINLRDGPGNFHMKPNGVFSVDGDGAVAVTSSDRFEEAVPHPAWATQSGPMLVIDGEIHPKFDADGESKLVRNGVGVRDPRSAFFVISEVGVSFGRFARLFRDRLGCDNALFLDGSVSSLWDPAKGRRDAYSRLGPMVVAFREAEPAR